MALRIVDIVDHDYCRLREQVPDQVARMVSDVLNASDPDLEFERYARRIVTGDQKSRRKGIAMLEAAFRIPLASLKRWLKERTLCNQSD